MKVTNLRCMGGWGHRVQHQVQISLLSSADCYCWTWDITNNIIVFGGVLWTLLGLLCPNHLSSIPDPRLRIYLMILQLNKRRVKKRLFLCSVTESIKLAEGTSDRPLLPDWRVKGAGYILRGGPEFQKIKIWDQLKFPPSFSDICRSKWVWPGTP